MDPEAGDGRAPLVALIILVGFVLAAGLAYVYGFYEARAYPFNTFLFLPNDRFLPGVPGIGNHIFGDFFGPWKHSRDANPYLAPSIPYASNYLPFTHVLLKPATWASYPVATGIFLISTSIATYTIVFRQVVSRDLASRILLSFIIAFLSYPFITNQDRGNIDILLFIAIWVMLEALLSGRWKLAAVALSIPVALKGTPALLALVFVSSRRWAAFVITVASSVALTMVGLLLLEGNLADNVEGVRKGLAGFSEARAAGTVGLQHNATITTMLDVLEHWVPWTGFLASHASVISTLVLIAVVVASLVFPLTLWERVTLLTAGLIVVPAASGDYRMLLMLAPLALALSPRTAREVPAAFLVLFGLLMIPKSLPVIWADVGVGAFLNPLIMLGMIGGVMAQGMRRRKAAGNEGLFPRDEPLSL